MNRQLPALLERHPQSQIQLTVPISTKIHLKEESEENEFPVTTRTPQLSKSMQTRLHHHDEKVTDSSHKCLYEGYLGLIPITPVPTLLWCHDDENVFLLLASISATSSSS